MVEIDDHCRQRRQLADVTVCSLALLQPRVLCRSDLHAHRAPLGGWRPPQNQVGGDKTAANTPENGLAEEKDGLGRQIPRSARIRSPLVIERSPAAWPLVIERSGGAPQEADADGPPD